MKIIGLTGPSGAGKGMAALFFEYYNIKSIDTDAVYREVIAPPSICLDELENEFGHEIILPDGTLDRKRLAGIVFSDKTKQRQKMLNSITHKYILARCKELMEEHRSSGARALILDVPLLFESGFDVHCDTTVSVIADKKTRIERIMVRDGITREAAISRIEAQMPDEFYISRSDYVVYNNGALADLKKQIDEMVERLEVCLN